MSRFRFCLLLAVICSCSQYGLAEKVTTPKTVIIPVEPQHPAVTEKVPEPVTEPAVAHKTTTTTTPAPTTTPEPTTTPAPTTTSSTTSTTTPAPTTTSAPTTTHAPTPAPTPGPLPPPEQGTWAFKDANKTCIVVQFAAQLNVSYSKKVNNVTSISLALLNVPKNATVRDGSCEGDQWIQLTWNTPNGSLPNNMTLVYHKNETTKNYRLLSLNVSLTSENFVNSSSTAPIELYHGEGWETPLATSYRCKPATLLKMSSDSAATLTLSQLQEEAYRTTNGTQFSAARECGGNDVPDAVPIAVGCALGGLVVVVLVAYLVGRRRSAARGYLSM